jgi:hypothetical protein
LAICCTPFSSPSYLLGGKTVVMNNCRLALEAVSLHLALQNIFSLLSMGDRTKQDIDFFERNTLCLWKKAKAEIICEPKMIKRQMGISLTRRHRRAKVR